MADISADSVLGFSARLIQLLAVSFSANNAVEGRYLFKILLNDIDPLVLPDINQVVFELPHDLLLSLVSKLQHLVLVLISLEVLVLSLLKLDEVSLIIRNSLLDQGRLGFVVEVIVLVANEAGRDVLFSFTNVIATG